MKALLQESERKQFEHRAVLTAGAASFDAAFAAQPANPSACASCGFFVSIPPL